MSDGALGWFDDREAAKEWSPATVYAMGFMAGEGQRVWFGGPQSQARERWARDARQAWLAEVKLVAQGQMASDQDRLITCLMVARGQKQAKPNPNGTLAERFLAAFGDDASTLGEQAAGLAAGIESKRLGGVLSAREWHSIGKKAAQDATMEEAWAQIDRSKNDNLPPLKEGAGWGEADASVDWEGVEVKARKLLTDRGLGLISLPGSWSLDAASRILDDVHGGLGLLERETGLGPGSSGLGGWGVSVGLPMDDASGRCYGRSRAIVLGADGGDGALAHEWLHALDFELARLDGARGVLMSERGADQGDFGPLLDEVVQKLTAPGLGSMNALSEAQQGLREFAQDFLEGSGVRNAIEEQATRDAYDESWRQKAQSMFEAADEPSERAAFEELKALYRTQRPALEDGDFDGLWSGFAAIKRPDPAWAAKLEAASSTSSDFLLSAMRLDASAKENYATQRCEMLARAFETSVALDAARQQLGVDSGVRMVSNSRDNSPWVPQGAERDRARQAFVAFFDKLRPVLASRADCPQWAKKSLPAALLEEGFARKLAARRASSQAAAPIESVRVGAQASQRKGTTL